MNDPLREQVWCWAELTEWVEGTEWIKRSLAPGRTLPRRKDFSMVVGVDLADTVLVERVTSGVTMPEVEPIALALLRPTKPGPGPVLAVGIGLRHWHFPAEHPCAA